MKKKIIEAVERNKVPVGEVLARYLTQRESIFEIGSGTGQHAVYFASKFRNLVWQTSELPDNMKNLKSWIDESCLDNVPEPLNFNVENFVGRSQSYDAVFTANTLHYFTKTALANFFSCAQKILKRNGILLVYGPFKLDENFASNGDFMLDVFLKKQNPEYGIKNLFKLNQKAMMCGFKLNSLHFLPMNNKLIAWIVQRN